MRRRSEGRFDVRLKDEQWLSWKLVFVHQNSTERKREGMQIRANFPRDWCKSVMDAMYGIWLQALVE
jgi:hypothetical protein